MSETTSQAATGRQEVSGAGGVPLASLPGGRSKAARSGDAVVARLAELGYTDAEQVVAAAAVPGVLDSMHGLPGIDGAALDALIERARASLPVARDAVMSSPAATLYGLGALTPDEDALAAAERSAQASRDVAEAVQLPAAVNLVPYMSPIRNQGSRGTCVSFTLTALNEYVLRRRGLDRDLSEQHLYYEIKLIDGAADQCGTWQSKAVKALAARGECPEAIWPYNPNPPCNNHGPLPAQARPAGLPYRLATHAVPARNVAAYKAEFAKQHAVTVSIPVYNSWYRSAEVNRSGRITMRVGSEAPEGGHAILLVGYQDASDAPGGGYFIVRNHWSTAWASQSVYGAGYGTIPYQYIANDASEAYSADVPGVGDVASDAVARDVAKTGEKSTVTIKVGSNVTITVESD